ncbi:hypothetical protein Agub_g14701, partial [Astrephomene gubernaculifera]
FCAYPKQEIMGHDIKCFTDSPGMCPLGNRTTRAHIQAAAEACVATTGCLAFTSDGWLKSAGSEAMQPATASYTTLVQGTYVLRPKGTGQPLDAFCFYEGQDLLDDGSGSTYARGTELPDVYG